MALSLGEQIQALKDYDLEALRSTWRLRWGPPPALRSVPLLRLMIGWRLQMQAHTGLDPATRAQLKRRGSPEAEGLSLGVGAKLRREWQGKIVEVEVVEGGFRWDGRAFKSLSAVATAISGTRWNGPRFFGLREQQR